MWQEAEYYLWSSFPHINDVTLFSALATFKFFEHIEKGNEYLPCTWNLMVCKWTLIRKEITKVFSFSRNRLLIIFLLHFSIALRIESPKTCIHWIPRRWRNVDPEPRGGARGEKKWWHGENKHTERHLFHISVCFQCHQSTQIRVFQATPPTTLESLRKWVTTLTWQPPLQNLSSAHTLTETSTSIC